MEENKKNADEMAKDTVTAGAGIAEKILNTANKINTETIIPTLGEGMKSLSEDEKIKEDIDKFTDFSKTAANTVAGIFNKVIKTGEEVLNENVIPAVKNVVDDMNGNKGE